MLTFLFKHGLNTVYALGEQLRPVVTTIVKATIRRIYGRDLKVGPSEEGNIVQRVLSLALATLHDKRRKLKGRDRHLAERPTAQTLPDDVLVEIFTCHRQAAIKYGPWRWHRLAQVCRRWRSVVFAYPRSLDLRIVSTYDKPIRSAPKFWPVIPIIISYPHAQTTASHTILALSNISDVLENPARICEIDLDITCPVLAKFASSLKPSFLALDRLRLGSRGADVMRAIVLPNNFLDGSAPRLRVLHLRGIAIPMLPRLLLSSKNLISLRLEDITHSRYFPAEDLVIGLSTATQLKFLELGFHPITTSTAFSPILGGPSPSSSCIILPSLTEFRYKGKSAYLRYFVSRIDTPIIEQISLFFYNSDDIHELYELFGLGDTLRSSRCHIHLSASHVVFTHHFSRAPSSPGLFRLQIPYDPFILFVSRLSLGLESQDVLPNVIHLEDGQDPACWFGLLRALTGLGLKAIQVAGELALVMVSALAQFTGGTVREILSALQGLRS